jgi:hypothetical protein
VARLSYCIRKDRRIGIAWGGFPPLSYLNGPVFSPGLNESEKAAALRTLLRWILRAHPFTSFAFTCEPSDKDALLVREEFLRAGFKHTKPAVSVRHPDQPCLMSKVSDDQAINKRRSHIRNARRKLTIVDSLGPDEFIAFYTENLEARGITRQGNYLDEAIARPLLTEGIARGHVRILAARRKKVSPDEPDAPLDAAIVIAGDKAIFSDALPEKEARPDATARPRRCYLLLLTYRLPRPDRTHDKPNPDANKVLILHAADFATKHGMIFDTGGAATPGADTFYRQLFPDERSRDHRDLFERMKWYAAWHDKFKLAYKQTAARYGIRRMRLTRENAGIILRKLFGFAPSKGSVQGSEDPSR